MDGRTDGLRVGDEEGLPKLLDTVCACDEKLSFKEC